MNRSYRPLEDDSGEMMYRRIYLLVSKHWCDWQAFGALFGLASGMLSIVVGALLWIVVHYTSGGRLGISLNLVEIVCFTLSLPLLALGACCLDLLEKRAPALSSPIRPQTAHYICYLGVHPKFPHGK